MINPNRDDFTQGGNSREESGAREEEAFAADVQTDAQPRSGRRATAGDTWQQAKDRALVARERTEFFLRENPVPTILGALGLGLAIGLAIRFATTPEEKQELKTPLGDVNWSWVSLPFLWPFFKNMKRKYEASAEAMKEGVDRLKEVDVRRYTKPMRERWKAWVD